MLNEKRVILMTRMASYEEGEGRRNLAIGRYFRGDYIALQLLKAFFSATISFVLVLALYIYYNFETFMEELYEIDLMGFLGGILRRYIWFLAIYLIIAYLVCAIKYMRARRKLRRYYGNLKRLGKIYEER